ncbi:hypothetical protein AXG93_4080s1060 [Marchantia polymorpha subsp. ruderalis]|uniref:Uncharacterized protein n=1 Tax=Marchantia polymorpha subsp. ruderalis TaxID=1480154 RepID=A0A176VXK6_MARPO|nr:hypothetical protein AXG93_4080s1060 [Marchantia polymorpha subsp. ruderalis]
MEAGKAGQGRIHPVGVVMQDTPFEIDPGTTKAVNPASKGCTTDPREHRSIHRSIDRAAGATADAVELRAKLRSIRQGLRENAERTGYVEPVSGATGQGGRSLAAYTGPGQRRRSAGDEARNVQFGAPYQRCCSRPAVAWRGLIPAGQARRSTGGAQSSHGHRHEHQLKEKGRTERP